jgi:putative ABC transport system permease protein
MNLTTARATERAREVGMRKVLGAVRKQLFWQFITESFIITIITLVLSTALTVISLPFFNELIDQKIAFSAFFTSNNLLFMLGLGLVITLLAGSYPALVLSGFQPIKVLKGSFKTSISGLMLRKSLTVFQFLVSIFLIVSTIIIQNQLKFIQNKKLGYNKEHVLVLPIDHQINEKLSTLKSVFKENREVLAISAAYETPVFINGGYSMWGQGMPQDKQKSIAALPADEDFIGTLGLEIVAGTNLSQTDIKLAGNEDDTKRYYNFVLNESAVKSMGWTIENAVGKKMNMGTQRQGEVKAVIKDFHYASLHQKIEPLVIFPDSYLNILMVRISGKNTAQTLASLGTEWKEIIPGRPFEYEFMDQEFNRLYTSEQQIGKAFTVFALLAIFLACLGLFGLATFTILQRTKEIGVRKILGASIVQILTILSKDFVKLVFIAFLIAMPLAYYVMNKWLQDFEYRVNFSAWIYILALGLTLLTTLLTISLQAIKAATMNPVKSLKTE